MNMNFARRFASSLNVNGTLWISGGMNGDEVLQTTEMIDTESKFSLDKMIYLCFDWQNFPKNETY